MTDKEISPQQRKLKLKSLKSNEELPKVDKNLIYHPSRFVVADKLQPITYNPKEVFQDFQHRIEEFETFKEVKTLQPSQQRVTQPKEFKKRPLRRLENDFQMYKEIFVQPKAQALQQLKEKEKDFEVLFTKGQAKNYDKILNIHKEEEEKHGAKTNKEKNLLGTMNIIKEEQQQLLKSSLNQHDNIDLKQEIDKLQNMDLNPSSEPTNQIFFDQQI